MTLDPAKVMGGGAVSAGRGRVPVWRVACGTVGFYLFLIAGSMFCGFSAMLVAWLPPRGNWSYHLARLWGRGLLVCSGCTLGHVGASTQDCPVVYMANHQSLFDIPALLAGLPGQNRLLAKRSLFRIPVFGWALLLAGFVPVDRADRRRGAHDYVAAVDRLRRGASIVVFPEETRSSDGRLLPFRRGGFLMAKKLAAPLVPLGIRGTFAVQPRHGWLVHPGRITVVWGEAIDMAAAEVRGMAELVRRVEDEVARLAATTRAAPEPAPTVE